MIVKLKISDIVIPQGLLPRVLTGTVAEVVERYKEALELGEEFPPIKVWKRESSYWLIDGVHRLSALRELGKEYVEAELVECKGELDFRVKAIQENIKHGLALSLEEIKENARLLFKAGLKDVEELARVFKKSERTIYRYVEDLMEEEKQNLRKQVLELREKGLSLQQIADQLGIDKATVSRCCKIDKMSKMQLSLPPTKEGLKLFSEFMELIDVETRGLAERWQAFLSARMAERGFEIEGDPVKFLAGLIDETRDVIKRFAEAGWDVVEKAVESIDWVKELSARARKTWLERSKRYWESIKEELEKKKEIERLVLETAKEILGDPVYIFSNWNNLAHAIRSKKEDFRQVVEGEIRDILLKHSDELLEVYNSIPEITEEEWEQIAGKKAMNYDEAMELAKLHNRRLPYATWLAWHQKVEASERALSSPTSLPPSDLAGSQPALSNEEEDEWVKGWEEAWREEQERKKQEKQEQEKQEKKEFRPIPPEEELERWSEEIFRIVAFVAEKYPEYFEEWWEEIVKEVRDGIEIRKRSGR
ncbi:ParB N-terminal domain-containing protein [Pampinifervens florentissimum]|uniref:RNA polymerase factor sigma-54 n=1 Tax=Pampinifervens florentissimum TaxID=1632019 RepID=UPI0013B491DC|nr:ParB/RepB/Spo0J family partition protein [Hydrogenobacter sp. T-8]QID32303.1 ParB N-terminal domain-containing protein [Hydrogenobacter sp. T-8]